MRNTVSRSSRRARASQPDRKRLARRTILSGSIFSLLPAAAALALLAPAKVSGATYYWSADQATAGGTGTWDMSTANWGDSGFSTFAPWPNALDSVANFKGTAGTVHLGASGLQANGLIFETNGYLIDDNGVAGRTLSLAGTNPFITTNAGVTARISAGMQFGSWTKDGIGTLVLSGNNTATSQGVITLQAGALQLGSGSALGGAAVSFGAGSNASLLLNGNNATVRGLTGDFTSTVSNAAAGSSVLTIDTAGLSNIFGGLLTDGAGGGSLSLAKTGLGSLFLTNNANDFSGDVVINNGSLVISNPHQLGSGTSAISINGVAQTGGVGFASGQLILNGAATGAGLTLDREVSIIGRGPGVTNSGGGLVSIGNNTLAGHVTIGGTASLGSITASHGITTISGTLQIGNVGNTSTLWGNGNYIVSGQVTGFEVATDRLVKSGQTLGTTLWLQNNNNSYAETLRVDSGTVRVSTNGALGANTSTQSVDLNNGTLEIRSDTFTGDSDFSARKLFSRDNTNNTLSVSRDLAGSAINQTLTLGDTRVTGINMTLNVNGRDGYNVLLRGLNNSNTSTIGAGGNNNTVINNNLNGTLTLDGASLWNNVDTSGARTFTLQGNGDTIVTGNIIASGNFHAVTKAGNGSLTILGTASTYTGNTSINAGTLNISTIGALNAAAGSGRIVFGGGALNYTGGAETWTNKTLLLNATNSILNNNGTGGLVIPQNIGNNGTGLKNLVLGGANTDVNDIQGTIINTTAGAGVTKLDSGNWQISTPGTSAATIGTAAASFPITASGTTATQTLTTTNTAGLVVGQPVSGTNIPFGTVITQIISPTQFAVSQSVTSSGTSITLGTVTGATAALNVTANTGNTLTVANTANLVPGQPISGPGMTSGGWYISGITSATQFTVANTTGAAALANSAAIGSQTPGVSSSFAGPLTIAGGTVTLNSTSATAEVINDSASVIFAADPIKANGYAGGTLVYKGFSTGSSETAGILTATAGAGTVQLASTAGTTNNLTFGSTAFSLGTGLNFVVPAGNNSVTLTAAPAAGLLNAHAYYNGSDFAYNSATSNSVLRAPVYGTDTGFSPVDTLVAGTNVAITTDASMAALAVTSLKMSGSPTLTLSGLLTIGGATGGGLLQTGGSGVITGTGITTASAGDLAIRVDAATDTLQLNAPITNTTTGGVTKNGLGTLILNAANANTTAGAFTINEGAVRLAGAATLGAQNVNLTMRQNTVLDLNGVNLTGSGAINALAGAGTITNSAASGTATLTFGNANASSYFSGLIQDGANAKLALTKSGTGTIAFSGLNTYTGATTITGGNFDVMNLANIGSPSGIGAGDATSDATNAASLILQGGSLRYVGTNTNAGISATGSPSVSINRLFTMAANGGIYSFGSSGNASSSRAANSAALIFNNTADIAFSGATSSRNLTLGGDSAGDNELRVHLVNNNTPSANFNTLALIKADAGLWILNPATANAYTGNTAITRGQLQAVDGFGVSANSLMQFSDATGGVFQTAGTFNRTVGTAAGNVAWTATGSGGFAASSAKLTVNLGAQTWGGASGGFLGTGALILNSATALADTEVTSDIDLGGGVSTPLSITNAASSAAITLASGTTAGLRLGQAIAGPGIPVNAVINGITDSTHFTISVNATAANTAAAATAQAVAGGSVQALTVTTTASSPTLTVTSGTTDGIVPGQPISGTNIPANSYVLSVSGNTITLNQNATTGATGNVAQALSTVGRTIQVDDNSSTNLDFATVSGVLSGNGGITKTGGGALILGNANTYTGSTSHQGGNLFVSSIGAAGATSSSLGANAGGSLLLGTGSTGVNLLYVGSGETTTRPIFLNTTGTVTIDSSGAGPLNLTSVTNIAGGTTTLSLRGTNVDNNMITSVLTNYGTNALTLNKTDGGVWILNPPAPNTFTGNINVSQGSGLLGLTANGIGSAAGLVLTNAGVFAYNGDLTSSVPVTLANNSTAVFAGSNNITFNGTLTKAAGANDQTFSNNLDAGKTLTFNGNFIDAETATSTTRTINLRGSGATVFNGVIQNNSTAANSNALKLDIRLANSGSVSLGGNSKASTQGFTGGILLGQGTLIVTNTGGLGPAANVLTLDGGVFTSTVDLNGANKIANAVNLQGDPVTFTGSSNLELGGVTALNGSRTVYNNLTAISPLTISGGITNSASATLTLAGTGDTLLNSNYAAGTGTASLAMSGTGTLNLTAANTLTGRLTVNRGTVSLSGASGSVNALADATAQILLNAGGTLVLDNSSANNAAGRIAGRTVLLAGGTLSMVSNGTASTETAGALTVNTQDAYLSFSGAGTNTLTFASVNFANSGSSLNLSSVANLGSSNKLLFTSTTGLGMVGTANVIPRVFLGSDFATYDSTNGGGIVPLASGAYANLTDLNNAATADTLKVTSAYTQPNLTASRTVNALALSGDGLTVGNAGSANVQLTVGSGAILSTGGSNTLAVPYLNVSGNADFQVNTNAALNVNGSIISGSNISKALTGTMIFNAPQYYGGTTNVLGGTLVLNAGTNTIFPVSTATLNVNRGATLDLNGNNQFVGPLGSGGALPNTGGTITSSTGSGLLVTVGNGVFAGTIAGANVAFARTGGNTTITLESPQTYGGPTTIMGGAFALENDAALLNTSSIDVNYANLSLNNNSGLQVANNDRINDAAPIRLRGATLTFNGRVDDATSEKFGALTLAQGASTISANVGGTGTAGAFTTADVTFASLTRTAGATVNLIGSNLGEAGNSSHIYFTGGAPTVANGALGAWAIANSTDFAAYNSVNGVGVVGTGGFVGYDNVLGSGKITALGTLSTNPLNTKLTAADNRTALLKLSGSFTNNVTFNTGTEVLNLEQGGLLRANTSFDSSIGTPSTRGVLTAGGSESTGTRELVAYYNGTGTYSFGSAVTTNGSNVVTMSSTLGLQPGMTLSNAGLPAGTVVTSVDSLTQITVSQPATATATGQTLTGGSFVNGVTTSGSAVITMNSTTGLVPGMTLTGTGIPAGTFIASVDDATHVTLSQNATANGSALTFTAGLSSLTINSVIADNGAGNHVALVKSGAGVMNLTANNTYTGGTIVNQGTLNLNGSGIVIPGTSLVINGGVQGTGAFVVMNTNGGQIAATNDVTLNGRATLSLQGNNTLKSLTFNNNGGDSAPTVIPTTSGQGVLTLTSNAPITASSSNAIGTASLTIPTVVLPSGANTFAIDPIQIGTRVYTAIQPTLSITSALTGAGSSVTKTGTGILQLSGQSTFNGLDLQQGGILLSANSTPTVGVLASGPLGTGDVAAAAGTSFFVDGSRTVANNITFAGTPTFNSTGISSWTLTLNGQSTLSNGAVTVQVANPFLTVNMMGRITNAAQITSITKSGPGAFNFNSTGYTGDINVSNLGLPNSTGATLSIFNDGNGTGTTETVAMGALNFDAGLVPAITVGRAGGMHPFTAAANKIIAPSSVTNAALGLTVTNNNGYGLQVTNAFTTTAGATYSVANATNSNVVQGLYFGGKVSGVGFTKIGNGALVLQNPANDFTGNITVGTGVLQIDADGELGAAANEVVLAPTTGTSTLRADGTFTLAHQIQLNGNTNTRAIEVTAGNNLTVNTAFDLQSGGATASLTKNDNGILSLGGNNSGWSGGLLINAGAVRLTSNTAAGTGAISIAPGSTATGAALQLANDVSISNGITLQGAGNQLLGGINFGGQLQSVSGNNTVSGAILAPNDAAIGADAGATLNLTGTLTENSANHQIWYSVDGTINQSGALGASGSATGFFAVQKFGAGTLNFTTAQTALISDGTGFRLNAGNTVFKGAGAWNGTFSNTSTNYVLLPGSTLTLDNTTASGGNLNNRLGNGKLIQFFGANFNLKGNDNTVTPTATTETMGAPNFQRGLTTITVSAPAGAGGANLLFTGNANVVANSQNNGTAPTGASVLFRGDNLGAAAGAGVATIRDSGSTGFTFNGATGATGTSTKSILPWAILETSATGDGSTAQFATGDSANTATFTTSNLRQLDPVTEMATNVAFASNVNERLTQNQAVTANVTPNSLTLESGGQVTINPLVALTFSSGGILAKAGNNGISGGIISHTAGISPLNIWAVGDLTISSLLHGGNGTTNGNIGFVKAGAGTLTLSTPMTAVPGLSGLSANSYSGQLVINQGTLKLNGGTNTIQNNNFLALDGGTLDLNGNSQQFYGIFTDSVTAGQGGTITSSTGTGNLIVNLDNSNRSFSGQITGPVNFAKTSNSGSGNITLTFYSPLTYTGRTLINGGTVTLRDQATMSGTSAIDINYATLNADNSSSTTDLNNRFSDTAPITLRGGTLQIIGRQQTASSETIGAISVDSGFGILNPNVGGTGINSIDLTIGGLSRPAGSAGTFIINGTNLGTIGNNSRVYSSSINGVAVTGTFGAGLTNNIVGGWAENGNDFLTYTPGFGFAALGQSGHAQYDLTNTFVGSNATRNIRLTSTTTIPAGGANANAVSMSGSNIALAFTGANDLLNITSGGLIGPNNNQAIGTAAIPGQVTAGGAAPTSASDLYVFNRGNTLTINSSIIDNPNVTGANAAVRAVYTALGGAITLVNPANSYTGGTVVNAGTLNLSGPAASAVIPLAADPANGFVVNGATVNTTAPGQIAAGNIVTLNGNSVLNLNGDNSLTGFVFNNVGGVTAPTVNTFTNNANPALSTLGVLTIGAGGIKATSSNVGSTSTIVGRVDFGSTAKTIDVDTINVNGVNDVVPLQAAFNLQGVIGSSGGLVKTGPGVLGLAAQELFTGPLIVQQGGVRINSVSGGSRLSALTLNAGTRLDLGGFSTTLGSLAGSGLVFNSSGATTLSVGFDGTSTTFSGSFQRFNDANLNAVSLTKVGAGTFTLTGPASNSTSTGVLTVNRGTVSFRDAGTNSFTTSSIVVNEGAALVLDDTGANNLANRLNNTGVNLMGGTLQVLGAAGTATAEASTGALTLGPSASSVNLTAGAGGTLTLQFGSLSQGANGTANFTGTNLGTDAKLLFTTAPGLTNGILARYAVNNTDFATYVAGTGITAYTGYVTPVNINDAGSTQTIKIDAPTGVTNFNTTHTVNALNVISNNTTIGSIGGLLPTQGMTVTSGGVLVNGNDATLSTPVVALGAEGIFRVNGNSLTINSAMTTGSGITKTGAGTLTLAGRQFYTGSTTQNLGNIKLAAGNNTIAVVPGATTPTVSNLIVNGGQFDLNGNNQVVGSIANNNVLSFLDGTITNSSATPATLTSATTSSTNFGGTMSGNLGLTRSGNATLTLSDGQTYTGPTIVRGGQLLLQDRGALYSGGTSTANAALVLNYGTFNYNNANYNPTADLNITRLPATVPVTLQGGTFTVNGGGSIDTAFTVNQLTVNGGGNGVNILPQVNEGSTVAMTVGNLVRDPSSHSTLNVNGFTQNNSSGTSTVAGQGYSVNGRFYINKLNGADFSSASLVNNLIGGWAVVDGNSFATYVDGVGITGLGAGVAGMTVPGFTGGDLSSTVATGNYSDGTTRTITGPHAANTWRSSVNQTISANTAVTLGTGLITNTNATISFTGADGTSTLAGTGTDLYVYVNQSTTNLNLKLTGGANLVKTGGATLGLAPTASNDFTGTTYVQSGTLTLNSTVANRIAIPHDLVINNATVTMNNVGGQIDASSNVTIGGGGILNLKGNNTLASLTYLTDGANQNPTVNTDTGLTISTGAITTTNDTFSYTPLIQGVSLTLGGTPVITTAGLSSNNLQINSPITSANAITKAGPGTLTLNPSIGLANSTLTSGSASLTVSSTTGLQVGMGVSGTGIPAGSIISSITDATHVVISANATASSTTTTVTFLGSGGNNTNASGFNLAGGSIILSQSSNLNGTTVTSGPVGTGTLTIGNGTAVMSDGTVRTLANPVTVAGDFTVGPLASSGFAGFSGNGVTFSGAVDFGSAARIIDIPSAFVTGTFSGTVASSVATGTALTKTGLGTLILPASASTLSGITVAGGVLKASVANQYTASQLTINPGATFDIAGFAHSFPTTSFGGQIFNSGGSQPYLVGGTSTTDITSPGDVSIGGLAATTVANFPVTKAGTGTLTLTESGRSNAPITVVSGGLAGGAENALTSGAITLGNATTVAGTNVSLDTGNFNQTIGSLTVGVNKSGSAANINITSGKTLTIGGNVTLGSNFSTSDVSVINFTGGGNLAVYGGAATFQIGGATGTSNFDTATADFTDLNSLTASLGTGTFRVGSNNGNGGSATLGATTALLPATTTITAANLGVGDASAEQANQLLRLGTGVTTFNVNTITVGGNNRGTGLINFTSGDTNGTLKVRAQDGAGRTAMNVGFGGSGTGLGISATVNLAGHSSDLLLSTLNIGGRSNGNTGNGDGAGTFTFDTGTLDAQTVTVASRSNLSNNGQVTGTLNLGGGTVNIGALNLALNSSAAGTATGGATAVVNITGGNVTLGPVSMANVSGSATNKATSTLNLSGGNVTVNGDITRANTAGTQTTTVKLAGATLDLTGHNIGSDTVAVGTLFQSGTLQNIGLINGAGSLDKSGPDTLTLTGVNGYTGGTTVSAGTLRVTSDAALGAAGGPIFINGGSLQFAGNVDTTRDLTVIDGSSALAVDANKIATLRGGLMFLGGLTKSGAGTLAIASDYSGSATINAGTLQVGAGGTTGTLDGDVVNNGTLAFNRSDSVTYGGTISGSGKLLKQGAGTLVFNGANNATGETEIQAGTLELHGSISGTMRVDTTGTLDVSNLVGGKYTVASGGFLYNDGAITGSVETSGTVHGNGTISGNLTANSGGVVSPGNSIGTLDVAGALAMNAGSMLDIELSGNPLTLSDRVIASSISLSTVAPGVTLNLSLMAGSVLEGTGQVFFIVNNTGSSSVSGSFANATSQLSFGADFGGETFTVLDAPVGANNAQLAISYDANFATGAFHGGNDIALMAVPEPGSATALALGLSAIAGLKRFRRRNRQSA